MRSHRALVAGNPRRFGRARAIAAERSPSLTEDAQLFAATFAGGFVFVTILFG